MIFSKTIRRFSKQQSKYFIELENKYGCHNYHPIPVVIDRGQGIYLYDQEGKQYMDFLAAYSAVNQGHSHPVITQALIDQCSRVSLTSRAYHNNQLGLAEEYLTKLLGYQKVLFMNSGVEAGESAIKIARRWAYNVKKVPANQARILFMRGNFWGRTIAACASSDDPSRYEGFGPFNGLNFDLIEYDNLKNNQNYAGVMFEPIQGERGIIIPSEGYLRQVRDLCTKYNVLMIADEIQTGLGRTGQMLACDWEQVRPDIITLAKALSGGLYPVSAILCDDYIMNQIKPGEHGSTFGGNPLGMAIMRSAMKVLIEEGMIQNSQIQGTRLINGLKNMKFNCIKEVRGRGLMIGLEFQSNDVSKNTAWDVCIRMAQKGLLAKPTHETTIRFTPPLVIKDYEVDRALEIISETLTELQAGKI